MSTTTAYRLARPGPTPIQPARGRSCPAPTACLIMVGMSFAFAKSLCVLRINNPPSLTSLERAEHHPLLHALTPHVHSQPRSIWQLRRKPFGRLQPKDDYAMLIGRSTLRWSGLFARVREGRFHRLKKKTRGANLPGVTVGTRQLEEEIFYPP